MLSRRVKKYATYILIISLLTPFLTGFLLVEPALAGDNSYQSILKGALMFFLLSFLGGDEETEVANPNQPPNQSESEVDYVRYQPTDKELDTLAKAIYSEARGESYTGQVAVGAVILNRIVSAKFPNTIDDVVYQKTNGSYAFSAVLDGQIDLTPNDQAYQAAKDALNGWDPTQGALYYYNPVTATAEWIFDHTVPIKRIGSHVFAKKRG
ncbi:MAG: cell wall hydrolase [Bacillota bacterium]